MNEKQLAGVFKSLSDENRIKIMNLLKHKELCASDLLTDLQISQPTLSHHLKILCESGIVDSHKIGTWIYYRISEEGINIMRRYLTQLIAEQGL